MIDSAKETACLDRAKIWEELIGWCEEMGKSDQFYCGNLQVSLTIGFCNAARREAKRRVLSWPEGLGWMAVCQECPVIATEAEPRLARPMTTGEIKAKVGQPDRDPAVMMSSFSDPGGAPSLKRGKTGKFKPGWYDPKTMTRAVARDLGLI
jgi:hypothetical protein